MGKVTLNPLLKSMSGEVPGNKGKICMRMRYGKEGTYHYEHKPETWSEAQIAVRQRIGVSQYLCRLVMSDEVRCAALQKAFRKQKKYVRFDGYIRAGLIDQLKADAALMERALGWLEEWKEVRMTQDEVALAEVMEKHKMLFF